MSRGDPRRRTATGSSTRGTTSTRSTSVSSIARRTGSPTRSISARTRPSCTSTRACSGSTRANPADGFDPAWLPERFARSEGPPRVRAVVVRVPEPRAELLSVGPVGQRLPAGPGPARRHALRLVPVRARPRHTRASAIAAGCHRRWMPKMSMPSRRSARGLRSGFAPRGRFAPEHEQAAHWFHREVSRAVAAKLT